MVKTKSLQVIISGPLRSSRQKSGEDQPQAISVSVWMLQGLRHRKRGNWNKVCAQPCLTCGVTPWSQWGLCATHWSEQGSWTLHFGRNGVCPQKELLASEAGMSEESEGPHTASCNETQVVVCVPAASCWAGTHVCISPKPYVWGLWGS